MIYLLVLAVAAVGTALYLLVMYNSIPGALEERFGGLEALPEDIDRWVIEADTEDVRAATDPALTREVRVLYAPAKGLFDRDQFIRQTRYRDQATRKIVRVDPDQAVLRRRRKT